MKIHQPRKPLVETVLNVAGLPCFRALVGFFFLLASIGTSANWPVSLTNQDGKPTLSPLLEKVTDAVVNISAEQAATEAVRFYDPFFDRVFRSRAQRPPPSSGSGVIVDAEQGLVVTNHHVIENAAKIEITLADSRIYEAKLLGSDFYTDVALLQIDADNLEAIDLGNSDDLNVGDFVIAIGSPFGLSQTVTTGIVSALGRDQLDLRRNPNEHRKYTDFIQTDASINPGNSGGALIDLYGNLVGINTLIISPSGTSSGLGFAIPSNMTKSVVEQLKEYGNIHRGLFGVVLAEITADVADELELDSTQGALIVSVSPGSSAEKAGVRRDDVVVGLDGRVIEDWSDLRREIALKRVGDEFDLAIIRNSRRLDLTASVEELSTATYYIDGNENSPLAGITFSEVPENHIVYRPEAGLLVQNIDNQSNAFRYGLRENDLLIRIDRQQINSIRQLQQWQLNYRPMVVWVVRDGSQRTFELR